MADAATHAKIWAAIREAAIAASGGLPVALPGEEYEPKGAPFVAISETIGPAERMSLRGSDPHRLRGSLTLRLSGPVDNALNTAESYRAVAANIAAAFPADRWLESDGQRVRVRENAVSGTGYRVDTWWNAAIVVRWETSL